MRKLLLLGAIFLGLAAPAHAVTLTDDNGTPIGGQLQAEANAALVPTLAGSLIIRQTDTPCTCSDGPKNEFVNADGSLQYQTPNWPAITWVTPGASVYAFEWELGHQFDWAYLTADDRREFAAMWHDPTAQWWDSARVLDGGGEDGLERVFAADYASCALGYMPQAAAEPANPEQVCQMIDNIGQRAGAHMPPPLPPTVGAVNVIPSRAVAHRARHHRLARRRAGMRRHRAAQHRCS